MPNQILTVSPTGRINRRDKPDEIGDDEVLSRENFIVIGTKNKKNKKIPGSDRLNATSAGTPPFVWAQRYYTGGAFRKSFAYNQNGTLYHIADNGTLTSLITTFSPLAYPSSAIMKVSGNDILYFAEGIANSIYSYDGNAGNTFTREGSVTLTPVIMISHLDRLWVVEEDSDSVNFSVNLNPVNFTDSTDAGTISIGAKRGSKIQALAILNETLYIFKSDSIWALLGKTPSEFTVVEVHPFRGIAARRSMQNVESAIIFLGDDYEFYSFGGTIESTKLLTYDLAIAGDLTKDLNQIINKDRMAQVASTYHNFLYRCAFTETGETQNNLEYIFVTTNETDTITRGNNVSCYMKWDRNPDKNELITGRSDIGRLMHQYRGLNWDNQATSPTMPIRIQTKFIGGGIQNQRFKRAWVNSEVLGAEPIRIRYYLDTRNAVSDSVNDEWVIQGETKSMTNNIRINSQLAVTSRVNLRHNAAKGQSISFEINQDRADVDFSFSSIDLEVVTKNIKRNQRVGI